MNTGDNDPNELYIGEGFDKLPAGFIDSILAPPDILDTSTDGLHRLVAQLSGPPRLVASNAQPVASSTSGFRAILASVPAPELTPPVAMPVNPALSFMQQVNTMVGGEPASPRELAEAVFRVNLTPRNAHIDTRPESELSDREKLAISALARKFTRDIRPPTLEEPTQLAIWRGMAQPLRF